MKMKSILISGSFRKTEIPTNIINFINKNILEEKNISFISASFNEYELNDKQTNKFLNAFKEKKLIFDNTYIIDSRYSKKEMIEIIKNNNIVFLLGGDTLEQIKSIKDYELIKSINNDNKIVIGVSAGAINMAEKVVLAKDIEDNIPELSIYNGLGITNINIEPHCDFNNKTHWNDLLEASMYTDLVVMHDDAYIILDDDNISYYGHYLILKKGKLYYRDRKCELEEFLKDIEFNNN